MSECMPIPDNWKDFVKEYSFKDIREIYTNGSWLIPTFRVEQMMEHFVKPEWISVKDRLPDKEGVYVLVCTERTTMYVSKYNGLTCPIKGEPNSENPIFMMGAIQLGGVTHWMPLPEPPKKNNYVDDKC